MSDSLVARLSTIGSQARLSRLMLRKGGIGVADQALISLASFVTMVLLARGLSPEGFGSFTLVYAALLFAGSVQSALITQPHAVLAATRTGSANTRVTGTLVLGQLALSEAGASLVVLAGLATRAAGSSWGDLLLALAPSIVAVQLRELTRRVLYTEGRLGAAFIGDLCTYGGLAAVVLGLWQTEQLSPEVALLAQAATAAVGAS